MRNDYKLVESADCQQQPHRFLGTLNTTPASDIINPSPSDQIKVLDSSQKPKTFTKQVRGADYIVLDVSQFNCNLDEADAVLKALKYSDAPSEKDQVLVVVSSPMSWSQTPPKANDSSFSEDEFTKRIPLPKYLVLKQLEQMALSLSQQNSRLRVHVVWAGFMYGNGEQNDIFYEFFRRAWVSLHPDLAALPVIEKGDNILPTVHVADLTSSIDLILTEGQYFKGSLFAVDDSNSTQREIMTAISEGIGSGATQQMSISQVVEEPWCEFLQVNVKLTVSPEL